MSHIVPCDVICLRPEADFLKLGVTPPEALSIRYLSPDNSDLGTHLSKARALVIPAVGPKLPAELFADSRIELVQVTGAGVDRVDADQMEANGIAVANVPGGSSLAIAEYAVSSALCLLRRTMWADGELRKGNYAEARSRMLGENLAGLEGLTVGVVGLGIIGIAVARAFHSMGAHIVYHDPATRDPEQVNEIKARALSLTELLETADVVTLHVPLLPTTQAMIGDNELAAMKAGAILINAARGGIVDEAALARQLTSGHLGAAAVDVFSTEPPLPDNPLFLMDNEASERLLITPHIAGVSRQSWEFLFRCAWQNVERVLIRNEVPANRVV
jgi:phosphoglycerate dehydrogenase-like enzyme